jgi:hypothetical protein
MSCDRAQTSNQRCTDQSTAKHFVGIAAKEKEAQEKCASELAIKPHASSDNLPQIARYLGLVRTGCIREQTEGQACL